MIYLCYVFGMKIGRGVIVLSSTEVAGPHFSISCSQNDAVCYPFPYLLCCVVSWADMKLLGFQDDIPSCSGLRLLLKPFSLPSPGRGSAGAVCLRCDREHPRLRLLRHSGAAAAPLQTHALPLVLPGEGRQKTRSSLEKYLSVLSVLFYHLS